MILVEDNNSWMNLSTFPRQIIVLSGSKTYGFIICTQSLVKNFTQGTNTFYNLYMMKFRET